MPIATGQLVALLSLDLVPSTRGSGSIREGQQGTTPEHAADVPNGPPSPPVLTSVL